MLVLESVVSPRELSWSACGVPPLWPPDGLRQAGRLLPDVWLHYWPIPLPHLMAERESARPVGTHWDIPEQRVLVSG